MENCSLRNSSIKKSKWSKNDYIEAIRKFKRSGVYKRRVRSTLQLSSSSDFKNKAPFVVEAAENKIEDAVLRAIDVVGDPNLSEIGNTDDDDNNTNSNSDIKICKKEEEHCEQENNYESCDSSSNSDEDDGTDYKLHSVISELKSKLGNWAIKHRITQVAIQELSALLNNTFNLDLPKDARTLKQTPKNVTITQYDDNNGQYWHNGVEVCLKKCFEGMVTDKIPKEISLNINIDGLPLYNSSKFEFWPILMDIYKMNRIKPMIVGIFCGQGKPSLIDNVLFSFCEEMTNILKNGVLINNRELKVKIRCFICDSPARAFVKGVANFNGQHGCLKCTTVGEFSHISKCNIFPRFNVEKRTDESFRSRYDEKHHKHYSPVEELPVNMVDDFPISDVLHLIYLGVMKKQLNGWKTGWFKTVNFKWSSKDVMEINKVLGNLKMPKEIHRKVRGLNCTAHWKGTEYSTFFHYISITILRDFLPNEFYQHFLKLFCAITICCSDSYKSYLPAAKAMLEGYLEDFIVLYGKHYVTSNIHNLSHVVDEVERFGNLSTFCAYPFESKLNHIKRLIKTGNNPLQQAANRLIELSTLRNFYKEDDLNYPILGKEINQTHELLPGFKHLFHNVQVADGLLLKNDARNKWFLTKTNEIVAVKFITTTPQNKVVIFGSSLKKLENFFETPIRSSYLHIFISNCEENEAQLYSITAIKCKMVAVNYRNKTVFIPLSHTLDLCA